MKSVVIHAEGSVRVEERPLPSIQAADDVLVRVICSGLCGSDIPRIFAKGAHYYPITLGHEFSGYVEAYGTDVADLKVGDGVACVPLLPVFPAPNVKKATTHYVSITSSLVHAVRAAMRNILLLSAQICSVFQRR